MVYSNIFEGGGSEQYQIIEPYIDRVKKIRAETVEEYTEKFIKELLSALASRDERETLPGWAKNVQEYRMTSEIVIAATLFQAVYQTASPLDDQLFELSDAEEDLKARELPPVFGAGSSFSKLIESLYRAIKKVGIERKWDVAILRLQILRMMGGLVDPDWSSLMAPLALQGTDYN